MGIRAGFIGLGNIGMPMARRLVQGGIDTTVFDVRDGAGCELEGLGARVARSTAELAGAVDAICICVRDDDEVRAVACGPDGVLAHAAAGAVVVLHSTILPATVCEIGAAATARGLGTIDAPITGGAGGAEAGTLTYMVGGDAALLERCRPLFATAAQHIIHTGPLGSGAATKLCNNLIGYLEYLATVEAWSLARHAGLSIDALLQVTRANGYVTESMAAFLRFRQAAENAPDDAALQARARNFTDLAEKDLAVTLAFARQHGVSLPGTAVCQQLMARVYGLRDEKRR
ncbi:MAG: NAD(P)-dependent oxidoreductase [Candidatus Binatia bacterium]